MKNLTIKKVALGLLLAGYAASGAFALSATTGSTIQGNKPVINAKSVAASPTVNSVDVKIFKGATSTLVPATDKWSVKDTIHVVFKVNDADGDLDNTNLTDATVKFTYLKGGSWTTAYLNPTLRAGLAAEADGSNLAGYRVAEWQIPTGAVNATKIGFIIQPKTQYGAPDKNNWFSVDDITSTAALGDGNSTTPPLTPPATPPVGGSGGGTGGTGTGPVIAGNSLGLKIVYIDTAGIAIPARGGDYQAANGAVAVGSKAAANPTITDKFEVQVWDGSSEVTSTAGYTAYDWYVTGGNSAADSATTTPAGADDLYFVQKGASRQFALPVNGTVTTTYLIGATAAENQAIQDNTTAGPATAITAANLPNAGLQGFTLGVYVH